MNKTQVIKFVRANLSSNLWNLIEAAAHGNNKYRRDKFRREVLSQIDEHRSTPYCHSPNEFTKCCSCNYYEWNSGEEFVCDVCFDGGYEGNMCKKCYEHSYVRTVLSVEKHLCSPCGQKELNP